jgi:uncharacterized protein YggE
MRLLFSLLLTLIPALPVTAQPTDPPVVQQPVVRTVTVEGVGTVEAEPDRATLQFAVVTRAAEPEDARRQNAEAAEQAMDAVRALGVEERKIQLLSLRLDEEYDYANNRRERIGFIARRDVKVTVDDLDLVPDLVAEVVQQGANELNGIQYELQNRDAVEDEALQAAVARARQKAGLMAGALGYALGPALTVAEGAVRFPRPQPVMYARAEMIEQTSADGNPGAYAAGEIVVRANVTVTFRLNPAPR